MVAFQENGSVAVVTVSSRSAMSEGSLSVKNRSFPGNENALSLGPELANDLEDTRTRDAQLF